MFDWKIASRKVGADALRVFKG